MTKPLTLTPDMVRLLETAHRTNIKRDHSLLLAQQLEDLVWTIKPHMPRRYGRARMDVLDIGCGLGVAALAVHKAMDGKVDSITLMDKQRVDAHAGKGGWHDDPDSMGASGDVKLAYTFIMKNMADDATWVHPFETDGKTFPDGKFNVIISTLSCGFHYPVATYAAAMLKALKGKGACVILDIRNGHEDEANKALGRAGEVIYEGSKHKRMCWKF